MILRQNIHVNVALVVVTESVFYVFCSRKREVTKPLFIIYRLLKFLCVFCLSCVVYIYKTLEEIGNREITQNGEKKSFEVGGLNDSTHYRLLSQYLYREKNIKSSSRW